MKGIGILLTAVVLIASMVSCGTVDVNNPPTADAGGPYFGNIGETISLNGTGSFDSDGTITSYAWDLDNDEVYDDAFGSEPTYSWFSGGTYTINLKVTDDDGATDTDTTTVDVNNG
jgi:PKD repeat protein